MLIFYALLGVAIVASILWFTGPFQRLSLKQRKKGRMLRIINHHRKKKGLGSLKAYYFLDRVATEHSRYMAKHRVCNHAGINYRRNKIEKRMWTGYMGENCHMFPAFDYNRRTAEKLVTGWLKSPGHRANLLNARYKRIGIGIVAKRGYVYATQIFTD